MTPNCQKVKKIPRNVFRIHWGSEITQKDFRRDMVFFSVLVMRKNGMGRTTSNLKESGMTPHTWWSWNLKIADIQFSKLPVRWTEDPWRRKVGTIHFSGDASKAELLFRTINSAKQLSIYEAVADWCDELDQQIPGQSFSSIEKSISKANEQLDCPLAPDDVKTKCKHFRLMFKHREIDCVIIEKNRKSVGRNKSDSNLRNSGVDNEGFSWTLLPNNPRHRRWIWRKTDACRRVYSTPWQGLLICGFTKIGPSSRSESRTTLNNIELEFK